MSKKLTVHCKSFKLDVEEVAGTIFIHKTKTTSFQMLEPSVNIFAGTPEEASYLIGALETVLGRSSSLEPKEKVKLAE